uniref:TIAM Rac1 associated GEF 1 n=1 Tax=Zonotrichia albicollis TaxID=44394 RepID=A0A8D2N6C7_ZONAL
MGNAESQSVEQALYGDKQPALGRKHTSRSLRLSGKASRRARHASSGKAAHHRGSEVSTRSSSTPSIPQSLAENGLEPFAAAEARLEDFGSATWAERVDMALRPVSYHTDSSVTPSVDSSTALTAASVHSVPDSEESRLYGDEPPFLAEADARALRYAANGAAFADAAAFKKKRSKSADIWREDSLEFSLSDLSQEHLTSNEEILGLAEEKEAETARGPEAGGSPQPLVACQRANSMSDLYSPKTPGATINGGPRNAFGGYCRSLVSDIPELGGHKMASVGAEDAPSSYSNYNTLPCRKSHCLSEGASNPQMSHSSSMQGRRAKTTQVRPFSAVLWHLLGWACRGRFSGSSSATPAMAGAPSTIPGCSKPHPARPWALPGIQGQPQLLSCCLSRWMHVWLWKLPGWGQGCTLFFYETDGRSGIDHNSIPKHAVWVENSIVQAVPEHPKKDFVFCLSNSLGDAFLFQTCSQTELENWITAIHSACATAVARQHHKEDTLKLLKTEIKKLEQKIDMDEKMKKMGEMQLSSVTDSKKKKTILDQIFVWEQNLEQFQMDLFRYRCYLASLQGGELPNPKRLLAFASRPTKVAMGRLGIFSVSSFHALVAARTGESGVRRRTQAMSRSASKRRSRFSSLWGLDTTSKKKQGRPSINQVFGEGVDSVKKSLEGIFDDTVPDGKRDKDVALSSVHQHNPDCDIWVHEYFTPSWFCLPNNQPVLTVIRPGDTSRDVLEMICKTHQLDCSAHYLRLKFLLDNQIQFYVPKPEEEIYELLYKEIEICQKITQHIQMEKSDASSDIYGFSLSSVEEEGIRRLYVNGVKDTGLAFKKGKAPPEPSQLRQTQGKALRAPLMSGCDLFVCTPVLRALLAGRPWVLVFHGSSTAAAGFPGGFGELWPCSHPCVALAGHSLCSDPDSSAEVAPEEAEAQDLESSDEAEKMSKSTEQVAAFCRSLHEMNPCECSAAPQDCGGPQLSTMRQLTDADKLRKVICELLETERTYVKDLNCLMERYLKPLQKETFLTPDELDVLFGNLTEMVAFQVEFLKTLEDGVRLVPDLEKLEKVEQFKKVLFSLGGSFLYYADRFKLYSAFCASHTKVPKVLVKAKTDTAFKAFLDAQNPRRQHSSTLESYLIKPIQRILKYPLLLKELFALTDVDSEEHYHLDVAIKTMNKVASHINEMQKIHEEYGAVFDQLIAEQTGEKKEVADLSMGDLLLHNTVIWLNPPASLGKWKKEPELAAFVFKTAVVLVYKDGSKQKKKLGGSHRASIYEDWDPFRFRHMIPLEALQVRALASADAETNSVCEIVHVKSESEGRPERTFHLCCSSPEHRKDFLKAVHSILRDKHRRQLLKTESLPSSQQYVPFGGKRLCALKGARPAMNRAVSAPSKSLGRRRRRLARNRFTIDSEALHGSSPEKEPAQGGDTDRWVEEQFDLAQYEEQEDIKETDILSDDDDFYGGSPREGPRLLWTSWNPRERHREGPAVPRPQELLVLHLEPNAQPWIQLLFPSVPGEKPALLPSGWSSRNCCSQFPPGEPGGSSGCTGLGLGLGSGLGLGLGLV